jgi:hypothetical protein
LCRGFYRTPVGRPHAKFAVEEAYRELCAVRELHYVSAYLSLSTGQFSVARHAAGTVYAKNKRVAFELLPVEVNDFSSVFFYRVRRAAIYRQV